MANEEKILAVLNELKTEINAVRSDIDLIKANITLEVFNRYGKNLKIRPFRFLANAKPSQVANFLQDEPAKIIALVLSNLEVDFAAMVLMKFSPDIQPEVVKEIARLGITSPETVKEVEKNLIKKLSNPPEIQYLTEEGNIATVVEILNRVDRSIEKFIINSLNENSPEIASEIRKRLFIFEDIATFENRALQLILREADSKDLAFAMKNVTQEFADRIYQNMSKRAAIALREEIESMGNVNIRKIEESQLRIINVVRRLEEMGELIIMGKIF